MPRSKFLNLVFALTMVASLLVGGSGAARAGHPIPPAASQPAPAMPGSPVDETKVPHYFGPYPNWANSPFTLPNVTVDITGDGTGATATATVGANGSVTGITITNPGSGYSTATIAIGGGGTGATADAVLTTSGVLTGISVGAPGAGYLDPQVIFSGGGGTGAAATAYGGVDLVPITFPTQFPGFTLPMVYFDMPSGQNGVTATGHALCDDGTGTNTSVACSTLTTSPLTVTGIQVDTEGSGYSSAPSFIVHDGPMAAPINNRVSVIAEAVRAQAQQSANPGRMSPQQANAVAAANAIPSGRGPLHILSATLDAFGSGYTAAPTVDIIDSTGTGTGAAATATFTSSGAVTGVANLVGGSGYITTGGIKKFQDGLPQLCIPGAGQTFANCANNNLGQHIPVAVPDTTTFPGTDYYVIAVVQHREQMNSSLPATGTLLREYVQLETTANASFSKHVALQNAPLDLTATPTPAQMPDGSQAYAVDDPHFLGPIIVAAKDRAVRIVFYNLLPTGAGGDLFIPVDTTFMGSGEANMAMGYDPTPTTGGTVMDSVRNQMCTEKYSDPTMRDMCFTENRATLHLHGGTSPWISDGTVDQWITPANEITPWPQGVDVSEVPDMVNAPGVPSCSSPTDGCMTFYYTNQQSARLLFYHDHSWGITRLNVYAGEAAGYLITDPTEQALFGQGGTFASLGEGIPLVIQDRTFVPQGDATTRTGQLYEQDPTWDESRWGGYGNFWYHHVYMPAQNPGDPSGMSAYGRWMYGPWFWPPQNDLKYGPIANPYYNMDPATGFTTPLAVPCNLDDPATWQYQTDPYCEPQLIPGTPNISAGMEQFNDTPIVNGTAYPTLTVDPKSYRLRILNAANDRFWNLQWYIGDPRTADTLLGPTEVALDPATLAAAQIDPNAYPLALKSLADYPVAGQTYDLQGPDWIQIGSEGGFLPAPAVIDGQQPITWIVDPTRFDFGNVDQHSLVVAPAERADVIVDFSQFAGKTLILYNDAPAAYPARVSSYDYYTGAPDLSPVGAPAILPGYGPNTRTIMQVKVNATTPANPFNLTALNNAFKHHVDGSGAFEAGQHPIIVGQAAYNSAYGKSFAAGGDCTSPTGANKCDGFVRINQQGGDMFRFDTLNMKQDGTYPTGLGQVSVKLEPKALHDEMNSATFDEFGRMTANLGVEAVPSNPGGQNINLMPFVFPPTEVWDATGLPSADVKVTPISSGADGTQIWKLTHNGVDTHPLHFHLYDVQVLNRVTWDNIIIPPDANELGWKDTVRISPLEDTILAIRPIIPKLPFDLPNAIRLLSPMMPTYQDADNSGDVSVGDVGVLGSASVSDALGLGIPPSAPNGEPIDVVNHYVNFGWEYVYHCHILSHEEMDMMRPVVVAIPPVAPSNLVVAPPTGNGNKKTVNLSWTDNSKSETAWEIQRSTSATGPWTSIATIPTAASLTPTTGQSTGGTMIYADVIGNTNTRYYYQVLAVNVVGDTWDYANPNINQIVSGGFPTATAKSTASAVTTWPLAAPTNLTAALQGSPLGVVLSWTDNAVDETGFVIERADNGGTFAQIATPGPRNNTGPVSYTDTNVSAGNTYQYRVKAVIGTALSSAWSNTVTVNVQAPAVPNLLSATIARQGNSDRVTLTWTNVAGATGYIVQRSTTSGFSAGTVTNINVAGGGTTSYVDTVSRGTPGVTQYWYRIIAVNPVQSAPSNVVPVTTV